MYTFIKNKLTAIHNQPILVFEGKKISKEGFFKEVDALAAGLYKEGISKDDVVCTNLPNTVNAIVLFYAANKRGAVANIVHPLVPVETLITTAKETHAKLLFVMDFFYSANKTAIDASGLKVVICRISDYLPFIKACIYRFKEEKPQKGLLYFNKLKRYGEETPVEKPQIAAYLHSGGTTGKAKTIMLTDDSFNNLAESLLLCVTPEDRNPYTNRELMVLPLFHGFGLGVCMHTIISHGLCATIMVRFNAKQAAKLIERDKITYIAGVPLMYKKFLSLDDRDFARLKTLRNLFCGGDKLTADLKAEFDQRFRSVGGKSELREGYGLTETVTVCTLNNPGDWEQGSMGFGIDGITLAILTESGELKYKDAKGEICVAGGTLMAGYLNEVTDNLFQKDGKTFVKTGDFGRLDENGKLYLVDRIKRLFKISGVNVFPSEIEETIRRLPYIYECVAIYKEEKKKLAVCVSLHKDAKLTKQEVEQGIIDECKSKLIYYSVPNCVKIYDSLPKTQVGKLDVGKLSAELDD